MASMPSPGFGTWRCDINLLEGAVYHAIKIGYRHIDCAGLYKNEHIVGAAIKHAIVDGFIASRKDLWITSKVAPTQMEAELVEPAVRKSIADLGCEYLDHYITHWPYAVDPSCTISPAPAEARRGYSIEAYMKVWRAMEALVDAGLIRTLGCSNTTVMKLEQLLAHARIRPTAIQVEMHPFLGQPSLVHWCARHSITVTGYCPLGSPGRPAQYRAEGDPDVLGSAIVQEIASEVQRSPAQVVLKWAVQRGTIPLPRTTTLARMEENWEGCHGSWSLSQAQMERLDSLDASKRSVGRIMKGDNFVPGGQDWREVWDEDYTPTD